MGGQRGVLGQGHPGGRDRYRTELTDPALLDAIGPCAGLRVLDAGCGEGASWFAHASVGALPLAGRAFDLVVCNHLFSHLPDPSGAVREFGRVRVESISTSSTGSSRLR